ncbi:aminopeptidase N [Dokdonella sp.]|uniref:aminopeptidase N n=1 Tax=Dokdonella sp. TaxID=2291710 RepID=UPI0031C7FCFB|nr:aminopeptidase N [Dokdonella sp.]
MNDSSGATPRVFLRDYRASAWRIEHIELTFDLDPDATEVAARLVVAVDPAQSGAPLVLDAEQLELLEVRVDGQALDPAQWKYAGAHLTLSGLPAHAVVETRVRIVPAHNTALEGLYLSGSRELGFLLTQCEAEGFRRITPFPDRPDVLARYTVTLRADRARYPLLLANGNAEAAGELADGRHWARFVDPHPKPSYLFALVAGRLETLSDRFTTSEGRQVQLFIHAEAEAIGRCAWAMQCLKRAMAWDEARFGRCYDLDQFHIVATHDFTMGAMENKGLNIFNAKYLLADPDSATDDDYRHVLAVIGHEYFHNWSGNRVTCRDWFQLCLKEGLTVYREQEFEADCASRTLRRIEDVKTLWRVQFSEDGGPLAHPVRPAQYREINNFYTATVYEKGAEIVRMLASVLGREGFRRGLDLYFMRHDGQAVTVEDFLAALGEANGRDLSPWLAWYTQAGTPEVQARIRHDASTATLELELRQHTAATAGQPDKQALPIPIDVALFDPAGAALPLRLAGEIEPVGRERILLLEAPAASFRFCDIGAAPTASLLRGFSAPVRLHHDLDAAALAALVRHESEGFNRWLAADTLVRRLFAQLLEHGRPEAGDVAAWTGSLHRALEETDIDPALAAELLTLPDAASLAADRNGIDPEAVHAARVGLQGALGQALEDSLLAICGRLASLDGRASDLASQAGRRLRNACLAALCHAGARHLALARAQFAAARNLTDRLAAMAALLDHGAGDADAVLAAFAARHAGNPLVLDKWFALQASVAHPDTVTRVEALTAHPDFHWSNPNNVHALLGSFALRNLRGFHRADGAGYRCVAEAILRLDSPTPQVAARLATAFGGWRRLEPARRRLMHAELERMAARAQLSPDLADILARTLAQ